jgi:hypothetical protein
MFGEPQAASTSTAPITSAVMREPYHRGDP